MKNTLTKIAALRRLVNIDYIFALTVLAGCAALLCMAVDLVVLHIGKYGITLL